MRMAMAKKSNLEHLMKLGAEGIATAIWNLCEDYCAYCPKNMKRSCNEDCRAGIREWLAAPYIPDSDVWKEKR